MSTRAALTADVIVAGGGLGACAAAIAAAESGAMVVMMVPGRRIGGQLTTQLVSALDEHETVEQFPGTAAYGALRAAIREASGGEANPGLGWVSRLCFEPRVAEGILTDWLGAAGVVIEHDAVVASATVRNASIQELVLADGTSVRGRVYCDGTELGDLLPLTGARWTTGSEGPRYAEEHALADADSRAMQSFTWCAGLERIPGACFAPVPRPAGYDRWRDRYGLDVRGWDGSTHRYRMYETGPDGRPPFWTYRRLARRPDRITLNWVSNDYAETTLIHEPDRATAEAREQTLGFVHWLQTEAPRDDGTGRGHPDLRLAPALSGTADGLAAEPYIRESRRLVVDRPLTARDIAPVPGRARARRVPDSVAVAQYHADLHPRVGAPETVYTPVAPFQIPLRTLIAGRPDNLLAAAKNIAGTQVAAAAYRVHSGEWAIGEAAGTLAGLCVSEQLPPARISGNEDGTMRLRRRLLDRGVAVAWTVDVPPGHPLFTISQLLVAAGGLSGDRLATLMLDPDSPVDDRERLALQAAAETCGLRPGSPPSVRAGRRDTWRDLVTAYAGQLAGART